MTGLKLTDQIVEADCLDFMRGLPDRCVDLVFCSPPYEDSRTYGIDFSLREEAWVAWAVERVVECVRVCRGLTAWVVEGRTRKFRWTATPALLMADLHRAGVHLRKPPIFHRVGIPGSGGPDWLRNDYELIVCAAHGKLPWSDNTAMGHPPRWAPGGEASHRLSSGARINQWGSSLERPCGSRDKHGRYKSKRRPSHRAVTAGDGRQPTAMANPGNVIRCKVGGGNLGCNLAHENEAPFPEALAEFFVRSFCAPGGVVYDPFSGSGTTAAVAKRCGRRYVATDIRSSQIELTRRRLKTVQPELPLTTDH